MAALTKDRATPRTDGVAFDRLVAADAVCFAGAIACLDADGLATPGATATTLTADGVFQKQVDNTGGADGAVRAPVRRGVFQFANSAGGDEITAAEIGDDCYIVDDQTVAKTDGTGTRSIAGRIEDLGTNGVWVRFA